jgi:hypothetical protein
MEASLEAQINPSAECLDGLGSQARSVTQDFYFKNISSEQQPH